MVYEVCEDRMFFALFFWSELMKVFKKYSRPKSNPSPQAVSFSYDFPEDPGCVSVRALVLFLIYLLTSFSFTHGLF
jgi:hypothetical protein